MFKKLRFLHRRDQQIAALHSQLAGLQEQLKTAQHAQAALFSKLDDIARGDSLLDVLSRIATAAEYTAAAEKHDRQANLKRHEF